MQEMVPLSALLSHALVAFTIEFDNEAEQRLQHWTTTNGRASGGPDAVWLTSMVMYCNCMHWLPAEGLAVAELERLARTSTNLDGMRRWGYVTVAPGAADERPKPPKRDLVVRPTMRGIAAQQVWNPLFDVIEGRWRERFGRLEVDALRDALGAVVTDLDRGLPDCMPILGYGMVCRGPKAKLGPQEMVEGLALPVLLARVLLAFALDFERESQLSLAISANVLRVMDEASVRVRDLPELSGVSKESIRVAMNILVKWKLAVEAKEGNRQVARLTKLGMEAQQTYELGLKRIEVRWGERFGDRIGRLRAVLTPLVGEGTAGRSPLFRGLEPHPEGWRAKVPAPKVLPHFPMVLHRGGYPDGS